MRNKTQGRNLQHMVEDISTGSVVAPSATLDAFLTGKGRTQCYPVVAPSATIEEEKRR